MISIVVSSVPFVGVYVTLTLSTSPIGWIFTVTVSSFAITFGASGRVTAITFTLTSTSSVVLSG